MTCFLLRPLALSFAPFRDLAAPKKTCSILPQYTNSVFPIASSGMQSLLLLLLLLLLLCKHWEVRMAALNQLFASCLIMPTADSILAKMGRAAQAQSSTLVDTT